MHKSASGGEPDVQKCIWRGARRTKVHLEGSQMHKSASGGTLSASGGSQMAVPAAQRAVLTAKGRCPRGGKYVRAEPISPHEYGDSGPLSSAQGDLLIAAPSTTTSALAIPMQTGLVPAPDSRACTKFCSKFMFDAKRLCCKDGPKLLR